MVNYASSIQVPNIMIVAVTADPCAVVNEKYSVPLVKAFSKLPAEADNVRSSNSVEDAVDRFVYDWLLATI